MPSAVLTKSFEVQSERVRYTDEAIVAQYPWHHTKLTKDGDKIVAAPSTTMIEFRTERKVPM